MSLRALRSYRSIDADTAVAASTHGDLLLLVFERIDRHLGSAALQFAAGDAAAADRSLDAAFELVLQGLKASLDKTRGGDIALRLEELYDWATRELLRARLRRDASIAHEVRRVLGELGEGFRTAAASLSAGAGQAR
jgi:flagellar protein FliS